MASDSEKYIDNLIKSSDLPCIGGNSPVEYGDMQTQYGAYNLRKFNEERAKYSTDYVKAQVQGLCRSDFYKYITTKIRFADIVGKSATATKRTDDYKEVLIPNCNIDYLPIGAKIITMGSTWIVVNPSNISTVTATAIVARCTSSYNTYDYYGNIITEPIVVEKYSMLNNNSDGSIHIEIAQGDFNVTCQANKYTRLLGENKRIILGTQAYSITGFTDFIQEFSGNRESCHLLTFTLRKSEPNINDDMENFIADGKPMTFNAKLTGQTKLNTGAVSQLTPIFLKDDKETSPTAEYPITFTYQSSDNSVATVDDNGQVTAISSGTAEITATLTENPLITATVEIVVSGSITSDYTAFTGVIPTEIKQYQKVIVTACYYDDGVPTDNPLEWNLSGAKKGSYFYKIINDGKAVEIECISPSNDKLQVTASYGEYSVTTEIELVGY